MTPKEIAERFTIFRSEVGSGVHGVSIKGTDDRDEMGVCVEPPSHVIGLTPFEQYIYRSAGGNNPSRPGDLDLVVYSLRKWVKLALQGNPTILLLLYTPSESWVLSFQYASLANDFRALAPKIASKAAHAPFSGYIRQQRMRMEGKLGQKNVNRQALVDKYGFDTKYAGHMIRLGMQGVEFLTTGRITLPMPVQEREAVVNIRNGKYPKDYIIEWANDLEHELDRARDRSPLPDEPEKEFVEDWMVGTYRNVWEGNV